MDLGIRNRRVNVSDIVVKVNYPGQFYYVMNEFEAMGSEMEFAPETIRQYTVLLSLSTCACFAVGGSQDGLWSGPTRPLLDL